MGLDHYSFKWSDFRADFTGGFQFLLQEESMIDVTLAVDGKLLHAHKLVLSVCSPYFMEIFKMNPCKHPVVILKDVSHHILSYMLEFMYKGEVGVKHEDLPAFLNLAGGLRVKGLAGKTESAIGYSKHEKPEQEISTATRLRRKRITHPVSDTDDESKVPPRVLRNRRQVKRRRHSGAGTEPKRKEELEVMKTRPGEIIEADEADDDSDCSPLVRLIIGKTEPMTVQPDIVADDKPTAPPDVQSSFEGEHLHGDDDDDDNDVSDNSGEYNGQPDIVADGKPTAPSDVQSSFEGEHLHGDDDDDNDVSDNSGEYNGRPDTHSPA